MNWETRLMSRSVRRSLSLASLNKLWNLFSWWHHGVEHYDDVIMGTIASQITSLTSVYSTVYSGADQSKHQSSASLAFVWGIHRGPVNSPHKWPVTRKMFPFDDVIMNASRSTGTLLSHLGLVLHICISESGQQGNHWPLVVCTLTGPGLPSNVTIVVSLNKLLNINSSYQWFDTPRHSCSATLMYFFLNSIVDYWVCCWMPWVPLSCSSPQCSLCCRKTRFRQDWQGSPSRMPCRWEHWKFSYHDAKFVITGNTGVCQYDNHNSTWRTVILNCPNYDQMCITAYLLCLENIPFASWTCQIKVQ